MTITHLTRLWLAATTLTLVACSQTTKEPATPDEVMLETMAHELMDEAVYLATVLTRCGSLTTEMANRTRDMRTVWLEFHGAALAGADAYDRQNRGDTREYRDQTLSLRAIAFRHQAQNRADKELRLHARSPLSKRRVCERRLAELETELDQAGYMDPESKQDQRVHEQLLGLAGEQEVTLSEVPSLAAGVPRDLDPGRSYLDIERELKRTCPDPTILVVANEWPHEAYGALCGRSSQTFISCSWGECRTP